MSSDTDRFVKIYSQSALTTMEIWVEKETGVNYLFHKSGYSGGLPPCWTGTASPL